MFSPGLKDVATMVYFALINIGWLFVSLFKSLYALGGSHYTVCLGWTVGPIDRSLVVSGYACTFFKYMFTLHTQNRNDFNQSRNVFVIVLTENSIIGQ